MEDNPVYKYLFDNGLTTLSQDEFINEYSTNLDKQKSLYDYLNSNGLTTLDQESFAGKYLQVSLPSLPEQPLPTTTESPDLEVQQPGILEQAGGLIKEGFTKTLPKNLFNFTGLISEMVMNASGKNGPEDIQKEAEKTADMIVSQQQSPLFMKEVYPTLDEKAKEYFNLSREGLVEKLTTDATNFSMGADMMKVGEELLGKETEKAKAPLDAWEAIASGDVGLMGRTAINLFAVGVPSIASAILTKGATIIPEVAGSIYKNVVEETAEKQGRSIEDVAKDEEVLTQVMGISIVSAAVEKLGLNKLTSPTMVETFTKSIGKGLLRGAKTEGITEVVQTGIESLGNTAISEDRAITIDDINNKEFLIALFNSFVGGALAGGPFGAGVDALSYKKPLEKETSSDIQETLESKIDDELNKIPTPDVVKVAPEVEKDVATVEKEILDEISSVLDAMGEDVTAEPVPVSTPEPVVPQAPKTTVSTARLVPKSKTTTTEARLIPKEENQPNESQKDITKFSWDNLSDQSTSVLESKKHDLLEDIPSAFDDEKVDLQNKLKAINYQLSIRQGEQHTKLEKPAKERVDDSIINLETGEVTTARGPKPGSKQLPKQPLGKRGRPKAVQTKEQIAAKENAANEARVEKLKSSFTKEFTSLVSGKYKPSVKTARIQTMKDKYSGIPEMSQELAELDKYEQTQLEIKKEEVEATTTKKRTEYDKINELKESTDANTVEKASKLEEINAQADRLLDMGDDMDASTAFSIISNIKTITSEQRTSVEKDPIDEAKINSILKALDKKAKLIAKNEGVKEIIAASKAELKDAKANRKKVASAVESIEIAINRAGDTADITELVDEYNSIRATYGFKPLTEEQIRRRASSDIIKSKVNKLKLSEGDKRKAQLNKIEQQQLEDELESISEIEDDKKRESALNKFLSRPEVQSRKSLANKANKLLSGGTVKFKAEDEKRFKKIEDADKKKKPSVRDVEAEILEQLKAMDKEAGFNLSDDAELYLMSADVKGEVSSETGLTNISEISEADYIDILRNKSGNNTVGTILSETIAKINEQRAKNNLPPIKFYKADSNTNTAGAHIIDGDNQYIVITEQSNTKFKHTPIHEGIHAYHAFLGQLATQVNEGTEFKNSIDNILNSVTSRLNEIFNTLELKLAFGEELTTLEEQVRFVYSKLSIENTGPFLETSAIYGLDNRMEFIAEAMSNEDFVYLLSMLDSNTDTNAKTSKSFATKVYEAFVNMLKKITPDVFNGNRSMYDDLIDTISDFEDRYLESDGLLSTTDGFEFALNITEKSSDGKKLFNKVRDTFYRKLVNMDNLQSVDSLTAYINRANSKFTTPLTDKEIKKIVGSIVRARATFADIKVLTNDVKNAMVNNKLYNTDTRYKAYIDDLTSINETLIREGRKQYKYVIKGALNDVLTSGKYNYQASNLIAKLKAKDRVRLLTDSPEFNYKNLGKFIDATKLLNPAQIVTAMARFNKQHSNTLFSAIYAPIMKASSAVQLKTHQYMVEGENSLFNVSKKYKLTEYDHTKAYLYGALLTSDTPIKLNSDDLQTTIKNNYEVIKKEIEAKIKAIEDGVYKRQTKKAAQDELKALDELINDFKLSKGQKALLDRFKEIIKENEAYVKINSESNWGNKFKQLYNYVPKKALGKLKDVQDYDAEQALKEADAKLLDLLSTNLSNKNKLQGIESAHTIARKKVKGYFYDNNLLSVANSYLHETLADTEVTSELKKLNYLLKDAKFREHIGEKNARIIQRTLKSNTQAIIKRGVGNYGDFVKYVEKIKNNLVVSRMGTIGQYATQLIGAIPSNTLYNRRGIGKASKLVMEAAFDSNKRSELDKFFKDNGLGIQVRDVLFEKFENVQDLNKGGLSKVTSNIKAFSDKSTTHVLRVSDKQAAQLVWLSAFLDNGGNIKNPSKEAIAHAERTTMLLQNISDVAFAPEIFRPESGYGRLAMSELMAFKSFALEQMANTYLSLSTIFDLNKDSDRAQAIKLLSANVASVITYQILATMLVKPLYSAIAGAVMGAEDEEEEKEFSKTTEIAVNGAMDLFFGGTPHMAYEFITYMLNNEILPYATADYYGQAPEDFDKYSQSPIFSKSKSLKEAIAAGPYSELMSDIIPTMSSNIYTFTSEYLGVETEEELSDSEIISTIVADGLRIMRFVPFRGDIAKVFDNYARTLKNQERAAKELEKRSASPQSKTTGKVRPKRRLKNRQLVKRKLSTNKQ